jgi:metallo-beta-lactamase family protein
VQRGRDKVEPIYTKADAEAALDQVQTCAYENGWSPSAGVRARYWNAGHILGSASIELEVRPVSDRALPPLFSGDIGPDEKPSTGPRRRRRPRLPLLESHLRRARPGRGDARAAPQKLGQEVKAALEAGGNLLIPAFAVERTQELLSTSRG